MQAQIEQYLHELPASLPEEDALTFWRIQQAAYPLLAPLAQDLADPARSCITGLRGAGVLRLWMADCWPQEQTL